MINFLESGVFPGGRGGAEYHPRSQTPVYIPAVTKQSHLQPGKRIRHSAIQQDHAADLNLRRKGAEAAGQTASGTERRNVPGTGRHQGLHHGPDLHRGFPHAGTFPSSRPSWPAYREKFPNIELHLVEGNSSELSTSLIRGDIDLIIDLLPFKAGKCRNRPHL